jgi:hypothetical protein
MFAAAVLNAGPDAMHDPIEVWTKNLLTQCNGFAPPDSAQSKCLLLQSQCRWISTKQQQLVVFILKQFPGSLSEKLCTGTHTRADHNQITV